MAKTMSKARAAGIQGRNPRSSKESGGGSRPMSGLAELDGFMSVAAARARYRIEAGSSSFLVVQSGDRRYFGASFMTAAISPVPSLMGGPFRLGAASPRGGGARSRISPRAR